MDFLSFPLLTTVCSGVLTACFTFSPAGPQLSPSGSVGLSISLLFSTFCWALGGPEGPGSQREGFPLLPLLQLRCAFVCKPRFRGQMESAFRSAVAIQEAILLKAFRDISKYLKRLDHEKTITIPYLERAIASESENS